MPGLIRTLPALCAFFVLAIALTACGDSLPGNAVVKVDDDPITRADFNRWMTIAQATAQTAQPSASRTVYNPPDFIACVTSLRKTAPKPAPGQPKPSDVALRAQCKKSYEDLRDQVLTFLINEKWIRGEAADQGIKLTDKQLNAEFDKIRKQQFPKPSSFQQYLKGAAMTLQDAKLQVSFNTLSSKLKDKITKESDKVTNQRVLDYYDKHKDRFATHEKRDIRIVLTKDQARANQSRAALEHGESWKAVTKRFSIDTGTKGKGGAVLGLDKGQQEPTVDKSIFGAAKGKLLGPIKTQFGYYVFQVQKIVPGRQQSLKQATPMIKRQLQSDLQRNAITRFTEELRKKWKAKTYCRKGYITQDCKNAPKQKTTATQPGGPQPNGQPQPQPQPAQPGP